MSVSTILLASLLNISPVPDVDKIFNAPPSDYMLLSEKLQTQLKADNIKSESLLSDNCKISISIKGHKKTDIGCTNIYADGDFIILSQHMVVTLILDSSISNYKNISL